MSDNRHSNFTMTPNVVYELLENELDIIKYQKLLRVVGIGNKWKRGSRLLAQRLGMSTGRLTKFKKVLEDVKFIKVTPGDKAQGIADEWHVLDIWQINTEYFSCSRNETGQSDFLSGTCSPNATTPCSRNETQEKIISEEFKQENIQEFAETAHSSSGAADGARRESGFLKKNSKKKPKPKPKKFSKTQNRDLYAKIAAVWRSKSTYDELQTLSERERGRINQAIGKLGKMNADPEHLPLFVEWWKSIPWLCGEAGEPYQPPRPEQIVEFWKVMLEWAIETKRIAPTGDDTQRDGGAAPPLISPDEMHEIVIYCPDCFGIGTGKGGRPCKHENIPVILEKLAQAVSDGEIKAELVDRFKIYLEGK